MRFPISVLAILMIVGFARADDSEQSWQIHGQVVGEQGAPVEDFEAATFWLSNGNWWDDAGELLKEAAAGKLWKNEGVLAASPKRIATRLPEGRAVDERHEHGGIVLVEQSEPDQPLTIMMAPLVRVTGEVYCSEADRTPDWTNAVVFVPDGKGNHTKLMICGSFQGKFSFLLPPGKYDFDVRSTSPNARIRTPKGQTGNDAAADLPVRGIRVEIPRGETTLDLACST